MKTIYIDESGNTGDITQKGVVQQPYFALTAVDFDENCIGEINSIINFFKSKRNLQQNELKSSNTYNDQKSLTVEILSALIRNRTPVWSELMDKKYYVACNLNTFTILQVWATSKIDEKAIHFANMSADYLNGELLLEEMEPFLCACRFPTLENVTKLYEYLASKARGFSNKDFRESYLLLIEKYIEELRDQNNSWGPERYLPVPDYLKSGKRLIMLPYVPAFSNLLARINKSLSDSGVIAAKLVHDEQVQYDDILCDYKKFCETEVRSDWINKAFKKNADFLLLRKHVLEFKNSKELIGLQVADLLSGFFTRGTIEMMAGTLNPDYRRIYDSLKATVNFVVPTVDTSVLFKYSQI